MAKLVSMKIDRKAREKMMDAPTLATEGPQYPWGLSLSLEQESLKKLGLSVGELEVGQEVSVIAKARVVSLSSNQSEGNDKNESASLQLTDVCVELEGADAAKALNALYEGD